MTELQSRSGSLTETDLLEVIMGAQRSTEGVVLEIFRDTGSRSFWFGGGRLTAAASSSPHEAFLGMLVKRKLLSSEQGAELSRNAEAEGIGVTQLLLRDRTLPLSDLTREMSLWASLLLVQSFSWSEAVYRILPEGDVDPPEESMIDLNLPAVLRRGVFKVLDIDEVRGLMRPWHEARPLPVAQAPFTAVSFDLDAHQQGFWSALDGKRTVAEILEFSSMSVGDSLRLLYLLQRTGMIGFDTEAEAPRVEAEQAVPSQEPESPSVEEPVSEPAADEEPDIPAPSAAADPSSATEASEPPTSEAPVPEAQGSPPAAEAQAERPVEDELAEAPGDGGASAASEPETAEAAPEEAPSAEGGIDMSSIRFKRRKGPKRESSGTFHSVTPGTKESVQPRGVGGLRVEVGVGQASTPEAPRAQEPSGSDSLSSLFDGMSLPEEQPQPRSPLGRAESWGRASSPGATQPTEPAEELSDPEGPPPGPGPSIDPEEWARLTTRDKDRIRGLRRELQRMETSNFFEWFGLSHESPVGSIKKAYFQMAKLYHPDSLVDDSDPYRDLAGALFSNYSSAYETLSDDEARDKYIRKAIFGEKDENDLALEKVQEILAAENSFKTGMRALHSGNLKNALRYFKAAVDGYEDEAEYVAYYGFTLFRARQASDPQGAREGIDFLKKAIELKEMAPKPYHLLGKVYLQAGDLQAARGYLRKSLKLQPDNPEAIRDYRRLDELIKTEKKDKGGKSRKGLLGVFGRKKGSEGSEADDDPLAGMDLDF